MSDELRVYFHFRSPYSRLGLHKLHEARIEDRIPTRLRLLTKAAGTDEPVNPMSTRPRMIYIMQDVPRATKKLGLPIQTPNPMDPPYAQAMRAFYAAQDAGKGLAFATALSHLRWGEGLNIGEQEVIDTALEKAGLPRGLSIDSSKARTMEDTEWLEKDGAFGVPFAVLDRNGEKERFWGQDRFDDLLDRLSA